MVMLPESHVSWLRLVATWSGHLLRLRELLARESLPSLGDLGDLAWLRVFDRDDLNEFVDEIQQVLIASIADENADALEEAVRAWRVTAKQIDDPLRRAVLTGEFSLTDYVAVDRP